MDKKPEKLVPEVRFKGFTDDWEQHKLGEISERILRKNSDLQSLLPLTISAQDGLVDQTIYFNKQVASKQLKNYLLLYNGDFAYNKSYSVGYPYGAIKRLDKYKQGVLSTLYIAFKPTNINSDFLQHYYDTDKWYREIYRNAAEGARNHGLLNISANDFFNSKLITPSDNDEQLKIAKIINVFNRLITLQQRKLKQLKRLKTAMLQQLFVEKNSKLPILRFKNFNGDWKQCKLGELVESLFQGINTAADKVEYSNNGLPIIQAKNITSGSLDFSGSRKLSVQKYSNYLDKYIPQKGDILFANIGTIGPNVILKDTRQFFIAWNILRIVPQKNINGEFLKITLDLLNSKHYFEKLLTGNATKFVNKNDMRNLPIFFSDPEEQNKISNLFKKLDFLITLQQNKLTQLSTLKKYLLQKMFI
ncbi:restriction endonuclease subunit S [Limosilactobacillus reuteri]|uniref:restriction endonuclease subunit S n=1 Tax=Limosilactobacillus reuteri TaxID=1598 RepID=UPI00259BAA2C|nr:restriction endonuclease subunit S [Limosilactobacillus reuteri]WJK31172.1 restriction endonuclease subunit S [Limosilactobacillus reuteri]